MPVATPEAPALSGFAARHMAALSRVKFRPMCAISDLEEVCRLRYRAYLNEGAIGPDVSGRLADAFDEMPNSRSFGVFHDGRLLSSMRISIGSERHPVTPATHAFGDLLDSKLAQGKIIVDSNRFVADPDRAGRIPELPYLTLRLGFMACEHFGADMATATARAEHQAFYRRVFGARALCPPRPYPTLTKPLSLMTVEFHEIREGTPRRYPAFRSTSQERDELFGGMAF